MFDILTDVISMWIDKQANNIASGFLETGYSGKIIVISGHEINGPYFFEDEHDTH
jgi:hypothetical protein